MNTLHLRAVIVAARASVVTEQWRGHASLPLPLPPLGRDHGVSEQRPENFVLKPALQELRLAAQQKGLDQFGTGKESHARRAPGDGERLSIGLLRDALQIVIEQLEEVKREPQRLGRWPDAGRV